MTRTFNKINTTDDSFVQQTPFKNILLVHMEYTHTLQQIQIRCNLVSTILLPNNIQNNQFVRYNSKFLIYLSLQSQGKKKKKHPPSQHQLRNKETPYCKTTITHFL